MTSSIPLSSWRTLSMWLPTSTIQLWSPKTSRFGDGELASTFPINCTKMLKNLSIWLNNCKEKTEGKSKRSKLASITPSSWDKTMKSSWLEMLLISLLAQKTSPNLSGILFAANLKKTLPYSLNDEIKSIFEFTNYFNHFYSFYF